jgi:hypothetical protein
MQRLTRSRVSAARAQPQHANSNNRHGYNETTRRHTPQSFLTVPDTRTSAQTGPSFNCPEAVRDCHLTPLNGAQQGSGATPLPRSGTAVFRTIQVVVDAAHRLVEITSNMSDPTDAAEAALAGQ